MGHFKDERTLVIIKPDGVQRSLIGEIVKRYERMGLKMIGLKMTIPSEQEVEKHYTIDPEWVTKVGNKAIENYKEKGQQPPSGDAVEVGQKVLERLKDYMTSGPVVLMVWQGAHAIELVRKVTGKTEPLASDVGTIRGDFLLDSYQMSDTDGRAIRNLVHASGSLDEAEKEIEHWFDPQEVKNYGLVQEKIFYDVNLNGILE